MKKNVIRVLIQSCAGGIVISFFLPWVLVDVDMVKSIGFVGRQADRLAGTQTFSRFFKAVDRTAANFSGPREAVKLSGFDLARSGRNRTTELLSNVLTLFGQGSKDPRKIAYLFLLPLVGVALGWVSIMGLGRFTFILKASSVLSMLLSLYMAVKLWSISFDTELAKITLMPGIWACCGLFFFMGMIGFGWKGRKLR